MGNGRATSSTVIQMEDFLDRLHTRARAQSALQRLAILTRIMLALAFLPTGLVKLLGERFTSMGMDNPVGLFFEALYRTGAYWHFIGLAQFVTAMLLLIPRTATLGAVLCFPIVLNIFIITVSLHFVGTPFITGGMLLGSVFLLCWDYDRLKLVLWPQRSRAGARAPLSLLERTGYALGTVSGLGVLGWTRGLVPAALMRVFLVLGACAALLVLVAWVRVARTLRANPGAT